MVRVRKEVKTESRILGIDDSPFARNADKDVLVVGTLFRGGSYLDGVLSTRVAIDGTDATDKLISMVIKSRFMLQIRVIMLDGIALGGFNVVDIHELSEKTGIPVIVVMRHLPDMERIRGTLAALDMEDRMTLVERAGPIRTVDNLYFQHAGIDRARAKRYLRLSCSRSSYPEPVRIAHMIGSGVVLGESRGRA